MSVFSKRQSYPVASVGEAAATESVPPPLPKSLPPSSAVNQMPNDTSSSQTQGGPQTPNYPNYPHRHHATPYYANYLVDAYPKPAKSVSQTPLLNSSKSPKCSTLMRYFLMIFFCSALFYLVLVNSKILTNVETSLKSWFERFGSGQHSGPALPFQIEPLIIRDVVVNTRSGRMKGFVQNVSGTEVNTFLSVRYGEPPIEQLRFRRTVPVKKWTGVYEATAIPPPCIQAEYTQRLFPVTILNENITEDCLFLNVWSPAKLTPNKPKNKKKLKNVMVMIHGGMFTIGSIGIDEYDGRMLAAYGDVVVVTIQYRLGIYGFLDMDDERIPGNMGLFDQLTALQWINQNIEYFGGNRNAVTLFGTSAGSISIGFHMFHPIASGLFRRAILQSGSPLLLKQVYSRGEQLAETFATKVGCYQPSSNGTIYDEPEPVVECLDQLSSETIYSIQGELVKNNPIPFLPTIPSDYLESFIQEYNETTEIKQKQLLMGFNTNEGALMLHAAYPNVYTRNEVPAYSKLSQVQRKVVEMGVDSGLNENQATSIASLLIRGKERDSSVRWAQTVADLFSDMMFVCPTYEFANKLYSLNVTSYLYLFGQRAKNSAWGEWMQVTHHDEIVFVMGYPLRNPTHYSTADIEVSQKMIKTWTHFAKTGKILSNEYWETWRPYNIAEKPFMNIKEGEFRMGNNFHQDSCDLYNLLSEYMT